MKILKKHRLESNPQEKVFVDEFIKQHCHLDNLDLIVFGHPSYSTTPKDHLSGREKEIILSTIQWLGSPVGQGFLDSCGFTLKNDK